MEGLHVFYTEFSIEVLKVVVHCCFGVPPKAVTALVKQVLQAASHPVGAATTGFAVQ